MLVSWQKDTGIVIENRPGRLSGSTRSGAGVVPNRELQDASLEILGAQHLRYLLLVSCDLHDATFLAIVQNSHKPVHSAHSTTWAAISTRFRPLRLAT